MSLFTISETEQAVSRRDRAKADKRRRIIDASRTLFSSKGFDQTTVQQIADLADVAVGTLFLYVSDKSELLLLIFNEAIGEELDSAKNLLATEENLVESVGKFFAQLLSMYERDLKLSQVYIREFLFHTGRVRVDLDAQTTSLLQLLRERLHIARQRGDIARSTDLDIAALHLYSLYHSVLSFQLAQCSPPQTGLLDKLLQSFWTGLRPKRARASRRG